MRQPLVQQGLLVFQFAFDQIQLLGQRCLLRLDAFDLLLHLLTLLLQLLNLPLGRFRTRSKQPHLTGHQIRDLGSTGGNLLQFRVKRDVCQFVALSLQTPPARHQLIQLSFDDDHLGFQQVRIEPD